jgi:hypothetical protein
MASNDGGEALFKLLFFVFGLLLLIISFLIWPFEVAAHNARQSSRQDAMARNASKLGLRLQQQQSKSIVGGFSHLEQLSAPVGSFDKYALNIIQGDYLGNDVTLFDYHYALMDGNWWWAPSWKTHHYSSFVVLHMDSHFPELTIQKEGFRMFEGIAEAFGGGDIDFESKRFSDRFKVQSRDKRFAYDFCNAKMIDYLLDQPIVAMEVERDTLAIGLGSQGNENDVVPKLNHLTKVRALMPDFMFDKQHRRSRKGDSLNDPTGAGSAKSRQTSRASVYEPAADAEPSGAE